MKVLYLYSGSRHSILNKINSGESSKHGFWGMLYLSQFGTDADYAEIEQSFPLWATKVFRKSVNVYFVHLPLFWKFFSYDIVFTSSAFGSQLLHTLLHIKRPKWVMHDFSITGLLGNEKTLRQKIFAFMVTRCAGIVTLSLDEKKKLEVRFPHLQGKIDFIPFGVDLVFFKPQNTQKERQILAVGLDPDRDWKTLVNATKDMGIKVILVTRKNRVKSVLPLPKNFELKELSARDLVLEYAKSSVFVIPLNSSGHNNDAMGCSVLFEAMAMGKSIIVTRTKATESYIKDKENGLLVDEGSVESMKNAIEFMLNNEQEAEKMGRNAYEYAIQNLDAKKCAKTLNDFLKRIYKED